jgi:hypothetical protein
MLTASSRRWPAATVNRVFRETEGRHRKPCSAGASALAVDKSGNLYILDTGNNRVRMVTTSGAISTIAVTGALGLAGDGGPATKATFSFPEGMAIDSEL